MSGTKDARDLRKQIRNVLQEVGRDLVASEAGETIEKKLLAEMNARLDQIDQYCQQALMKQDKRAKDVQTFLITEVLGKVQNDLHNANVTVECVVETLAESGFNIPDFAAKVEAKKPEMSKRMIDRADREMREKMERRNAEQKAKEDAAKLAAEAAPATESPDQV